MGFPYVDEDYLTDYTGMQLNHLLRNVGEAIIHEYDFGDGWEHRITLEEIKDDHPSQNKDTLVCLAGKGACPLEDCGGPWGFENLKAAMADPDHPERKELVEWLGEVFDPKQFSLGEVNDRLRSLA